MNILYSQRGGYRVSNVDMSVSSSGGTWPLASLTLTDESIIFTWPRNRMEIGYSDIEHIEVTNSGFIKFINADNSKSFAFTSVGLPKIIELLKEKQVDVTEAQLQKVKTANFVVWLQVIFGLVFVAFWLFLFLVPIQNH
jgi:hypothetical protein